MKSTIKPTITPYLFRDKSFTNPVTFWKPCIQNFKFENENGEISYEWLPTNEFKSIYEVMKQAKEFMYLSSGLTSRCYTLINVDIDYDNWNFKFLEIVKKLYPSCILMRKSNKHLQIQFQGSYNRLMPHSLSYTHKSWQEGMNEIIYKISRYCKLDWQLSELNKNNSTTCQNVYHSDFERLYFNPNSRSLEWFDYSTGKFTYFDKSQINFLVQNSICLYQTGKPLPLNNSDTGKNEAIDTANIDNISLYSYNIEMQHCNSDNEAEAGITIKNENSPLIDNTNDKMLVEFIRNYVWDYMRKNDSKPELEQIYNEALDYANRTFSNSDKPKSEIKAVARCTGLWAIRHFKKIENRKSNNEVDFVKIYKEAKLFTRYCFAIFGNSNPNRRTLSRYRSYNRDKINSIYQSALKFKSYANPNKHSNLLKDIDNAISLFNSNNPLSSHNMAMEALSD